MPISWISDHTEIRRLTRTTIDPWWGDVGAVEGAWLGDVGKRLILGMLTPSLNSSLHFLLLSYHHIVLFGWNRLEVGPVAVVEIRFSLWWTGWSHDIKMQWSCKMVLDFTGTQPTATIQDPRRVLKVPNLSMACVPFRVQPWWLRHGGDYVRWLCHEYRMHANLSCSRISMISYEEDREVTLLTKILIKLIKLNKESEGWFAFAPIRVQGSPSWSSSETEEPDLEGKSSVAESAIKASQQTHIVETWNKASWSIH